MERESRAYLWDAKAAADAIAEFTGGKSIDDYKADEMLRAAVERKFEIIGEALGQLARHDPELAEQVPDHAQIVAFRNILIHGYAVVDNETVWSVVETELPRLRNVLTRLLGAA